MKPERIPLFPLNVVLFPGELMPLHIFEPRYREMTARCIEEKIAFGLISAQADKIASIGCTAQIERVLKNYPDGRSDILTVGADAFRMVRLIDEKAYYEAIVEYLEDEAFDAATSASAEELVQAARKCIELAAGEAGDIKADPADARLSYRLASYLPLDFATKQALLESRREEERRSLLSAAVRELLPKIERTEHLRGKAAGNGHSHT